MLLLQADWYSL